MQFAITSSSTVMASPVSYQKDVTNIRNDPAFGIPCSSGANGGIGT
jgi:hypothetical protein